ncbi:hypothetical protein DOTSEDRAFT_72701 [Dothistroma septosporum NZE10]|uniref:Uncharacterized protein n=1 Tax=Dothistroma septosporum (strain NZE10 / CBS 128990) TaxID=675120 RepID=M2YN65_DOTSN|nr:hypothetical protein DOTSEDRAFT_72701 [Dothistroma septosporum NZE10]
MATHAPVARVPFAPLDNPRLQHLASAKNRQNGLIANASSGKSNITKISPGKRAFEADIYEDFDSENVDPTVVDSPTKKLKNDVKPFTFSLAPQKSMPPPSITPSRMLTPKANMSTPRTPLTAPAGRSPKRKIAKPVRRVSAPFSRNDPPFARSASSLPFSLDAALSGSLKSAGATIQETMPKDWYFEIYQDTSEEEASNLMEHSTLTLDLSSDDEDTKKHDDRGKENTPPEGYSAPAASRSGVAVPKAVKKTELVRRKIVVDEMDDGARSPLSDLETDPFFPEGLHKDSHIVMDGVEEKEMKLDVKALYAKEVVAEKTFLTMPVAAKQGDVKGEIAVWEDLSAEDEGK